MDNKTIFYSALFLFSFMAVASEKKSQQMILAQVMFNQQDIKGTDVLCLGRKYEVVGSDYLFKHQEILHFLSNITIEREDRSYENYIKFIDSQSRGIVCFSLENKSNLITKLTHDYDCHKRKNNGWLYNSNTSLNLRLVESITKPEQSKNVVFFELQPEQVEEILGLTSLRNWRWAKRAVLFIGLVFLIKNYSQLIQMINGN